MVDQIPQSLAPQQDLMKMDFGLPSPSAQGVSSQDQMMAGAKASPLAAQPVGLPVTVPSPAPAAAVSAPRPASPPAATPNQADLIKKLTQ